MDDLVAQIEQATLSKSTAPHTFEIPDKDWLVIEAFLQALGLNTHDWVVRTLSEYADSVYDKLAIVNSEWTLGPPDSQGAPDASG